MQGSGLRGAARGRLGEPDDDWLGDLSEYDWSENAAEHAERAHTRPSREGLVAVVDDTRRRTPGPVDAAEARRAVVERRRLVAGLVLAVALAVVIVISLMLLRGGNETPAAGPSTTTTTPPATSTPATGTPAPTEEAPTLDTPETTPSTTSPSADAAASFTLPEGTKLRLGEGDSELIRQLQQALITVGYDPGSVDGTFGPLTEAAVIAFQEANGLSADGVVGPETASALDSALTAG